MRKIIILYNDAGGGHRAAANALREILDQKNNYQVELLNPYKDFGSSIDLVKKLTGTQAEDVYNRLVSSRSTAMFSLLLIAGIFKLNLFLYSRSIIREFKKIWCNKNPDIVISVTPFINKYVAKSIDQIPNNIAFITLVTDYSECTKGVWLFSGNQKIICASNKIVRQALQRNIHRHNIHKVSGMIVSPKFYPSNILDKEIYRHRLQLDPKIFTGLVMFGSHGTQEIMQVAENMRGCKYQLQLIFICGRNYFLEKALHNLSVDYKKVVLGFVDNIHEYMRCADFMISKPGGISISEATVSGLPMIIKSNMFTLLQERYNADWVKEQGIGYGVKNFKNIRAVVERFNKNIDFYRRNFKKIDNKAIFEISGILEEVMV